MDLRVPMYEMASSQPTNNPNTMEPIRETIRFHVSSKYFNDVVVPYLAEKSPNVDFNFLFINEKSCIYEHIVSRAENVLGKLDIGEYDKVCIYGLPRNLIHDVVLPLRKHRYSDIAECI